MDNPGLIDRRQWLRGVSALALLSACPLARAFETKQIIKKVIPVSGEAIPAIGMGTWITFDVGRNQKRLQNCLAVLRAFFSHGGSLIDSSPMYGSAQEVLGWCLPRLDPQPDLFSATKVWVPGQDRGVYQMDASEKLWGVRRFDLMQVHNMVDWQTHLETLLAWKEQGRVRYTGISTSHGSRHPRMLQVIEHQPFDFVQFTYNIMDREAERRLLPAALEQGKAVLINRPFQTGRLFQLVQGKPLPAWVAAIDCQNWAQYFLKFVISHPAVTCAIPATSQVAHMQENMGAAYGRLPDPEQRRRMLKDFSALI